MKIVVSVNGRDLDAPMSPIFGRCAAYILVDTETLDYEVLDNPAISAGGGAGVQAAQFVIGRGAEAVITGNVGPNAFGVFQAGGATVYLAKEGTVRAAVEAYNEGHLSLAQGASVASHSGMGRCMGRGRAQ